MSVLTIILLTVIAIGGVLRPRTATRPPVARWLQIASYRHGTIAHLTPVRDPSHTEDENGECDCNPRAAPYPLASGRTGTLYLHRQIANDNNRRAR